MGRLDQLDLTRRLSRTEQDVRIAAAQARLGWVGFSGSRQTRTLIR